jgi:medium-chain acyl-[acyl-carrier-protein] hydrolase
MTARGWFPFGAPADAAMRLFCLPYAGGGASTYRAWLRPDAALAICPVLPPGREARIRERAHTRLEDYVADLAQTIEPHLDRPYALFGHSLGALAAFELARVLMRRGHRSPTHLFASGAAAPKRPRLVPRHDLPQSDLIAELKRLGGTPAQVFEQPELLELVLPPLRADFGISSNYHYVAGPPLSCPITAFVGTSDPFAALTDVERWAEETTGRFRLHEISGDHFFLHAADAHLREIVRSEVLSG